jgi:uncharacterized metal-binding protein YceD (DUF177 family)
MTAPEFSRPLRLDAIGDGAGSRAVAADAAERAALAIRFDLAAVDRLEGRFEVRRDAGGVRVTGKITGHVTQRCVVSGAPLPANVDEAVELLFVRPSGSDAAGDTEEVELGTSDLDVLPLEGEAIDLGEIAAETLALALPSFPRAADADLADERRLLTSEDEAAEATRAAANPFAALKDRK